MPRFSARLLVVSVALLLLVSPSASLGQGAPSSSASAGQLQPESSNAWGGNSTGVFDSGTSTTSSRTYVDYAVETANRVARYQWDPTNSGYYTAMIRNWTSPDDNTKELVFKYWALAWFWLYDRTGNSTYLGYAKSYMNTLVDKAWANGFYDSYTSTWSPDTSAKSAAGNGITMWELTMAYARTGNKTYYAYANKTANWVIDNLWDSGNGCFWEDTTKIGTQVYVEGCSDAIIGLMSLYQINRNSTYETYIGRSISFITSAWDSKYGGFYARVGPSGSCSTILNGCNKYPNENTWPIIALSYYYSIFGGTASKYYADKGVSYINSTLWDWSPAYNGGLFRSLYQNDTIRDNTKTAWDNCGEPWMIWVASENVGGNSTYQTIARRILNWCTAYLHDGIYGGFFTEVTRDGSATTFSTKDAESISDSIASLSLVTPAPVPQTDVPYLNLSVVLANKLHRFMLNGVSNAYYNEVSGNWQTVVTPAYSTLGNAFIDLGMVQLYQATANETYLHWASAASESFWRNAWSAKLGGFYDTYSSGWKNTTCQQTAQPNALFEVDFLRLASANGSAVWLQRATAVERLLNSRFWSTTDNVVEQSYDVCKGTRSGDVQIEVSIGSYLWATAEWTRYTSNSTFGGRMSAAASFAENYLWDGTANTLSGGPGSTDCGSTNGYLGFMRSAYANLTGLEDCRKGANENIWGAMGLAELDNISSSPTLLQFTNRDLRWINETFWDPTNGGYHETAYRNDTLRSACSSTHDPRDYPGWTEGEQPMFWWQLGQLAGNATETRWAGVAEQWTARHQWNSAYGGEMTCLDSDTLPDPSQTTLLDWLQGSALYTYSTIAASVGAPPLSVLVSPVSVSSGKAATLTASPSGGSGVYSYAWYMGACPPSGGVLGSSASYTTGILTSPPPTDAYCAKVTDSLGEVVTATGTVTVIPSSVQLTFSYEVTGGGAGYSAPVLTYTSGGSSKAANLGTNPTIYSADAGTTWSVSQSLPGSSAMQRWQTSQGYTGTASGPTAIVFDYYHQYSLTLSYTVSGGGTPAAPFTSCRRFGSPSSDTLTATPTVYWEDSSCPGSTTNPINGASGERWDTKGVVSGTVTGPFSEVLTYYHQYYVGYALAIEGGGSPSVISIVSYRQFGGVLKLTPSASGVAAWTDAGSTSSYANPMAGGSGERWNAPASTFLITSPVTEDPTYFHQYQATFDYSVSDTSTPPAAGLAGAVTYQALGATAHDTPAKSAGPTDWVDAGTAVLYVSPIYGIGTEKWQISPGDTGRDTVISSVNSPTVADPTYTHYLAGLRTTVSTVAPVASSETIGSTSPLTLTATVEDVGSGTPLAPTGTVGWSDGGKGGRFSSASCTLSTSTSSSSACAVTYTPSPSSPAGTITVTASYSGDAQHSFSSGSGSITVNLRSTSTSITPSSLSVPQGTPITSTATVTDTGAGTATSPTGTVTWKVSGLRATASCTLKASRPGVSTCSVTGVLPTGSYTVTAKYSGDTTHAASGGSSSITVNVTAGPSTSVAFVPVNTPSGWRLVGLSAPPVATPTLPRADKTSRLPPK